jgi:hypothetical protein
VRAESVWLRFDLRASGSEDASRPVGEKLTLVRTAVCVSLGCRLEVGTNRPRVGTNGLEVGTNRLRVGTNGLEVGTNGLEVGTNRLRVGTNGLEVGTNRLRVGTHRRWEGARRWRAVTRYASRGLLCLHEVTRDSVQNAAPCGTAPKAHASGASTSTSAHAAVPSAAATAPVKRKAARLPPVIERAGVAMGESPSTTTQTATFFTLWCGGALSDAGPG